MKRLGFVMQTGKSQMEPVYRLLYIPPITKAYHRNANRIKKDARFFNRSSYIKEINTYRKLTVLYRAVSQFEVLLLFVILRLSNPYQSRFVFDLLAEALNRTH